MKRAKEASYAAFELKEADQRRFIHECGSKRAAVEAGAKLSRLVWELALATDQAEAMLAVGAKTTNGYVVLREDDFRGRVARDFPDDGAISWLIELLSVNAESRSSSIWKAGEGRLAVSKWLASPIFCVQILLGNESAIEADTRYFIAKSIREKYGCSLSHGLRHEFQVLCDFFNKTLKERDPLHPAHRNVQVNAFFDDCFVSLINDPKADGTREDESRANDHIDRVSLFFEVARFADIIRLDQEPNKIRLRVAEADCEYLIGQLFGLPLDMPGLDELFGGCGPILYDPLCAGSPPRAEDLLDGIKTRTIVISGAIGCGKSVLASQLAVEVARKCGIAFMMLMEQKPEEALYAMESLGVMKGRQGFSIGTDLGSAIAAIRYKRQDSGVLIMLNPDIRGIDSFYAELLRTAETMPRDVLRLFVVDPLNSLASPAEDELGPSGTEDAARADREADRSIRKDTLELIDSMKTIGINLMLVVEEPMQGRREASASAANLLVAENIADTVIHLDIKPSHQYSQRYVTMIKSRLQREQRGAHPFSIGAGTGFQVFPSPASVSGRIRRRRHFVPKETIAFGMEEVDRILGEEGLYLGDMIGFVGAGGTLKTALGLRFLASAAAADGICLAFSARDNPESLQFLMESMIGGEALQNIRVHSLPRGFAHPGVILQYVERAILEEKRRGRKVARALIDSIDQWDAASPLVKDDKTFMGTLIDLLRGHRVTTLLICREVRNEEETPCQLAVQRNVDCLFSFERFEYKGLRRITMRVDRTRGMTHKPEPFEISASKRGNGTDLQIAPSSSLLRVSREEGLARPIPIRLFFHMETEAQRAYCNSMRGVIQSVLSGKTSIDYQDRLFLNGALGIGRFSAMDELQIIQLDEYQLGLHMRSRGKDVPALLEFRGDSWDEAAWAGMDDHLLWGRSVLGNSAARRIKSFVAVPYYQNLGILLFDPARVGDESILDDWRKLADACSEWEGAHPAQPMADGAPGKAPLYFDFPKVTHENYNCLFLEILLSMEPFSGGSEANETRCTIERWLLSDEAIAAAVAFRQLARRAYLYSDQGMFGDSSLEAERLQRPYKVDPDAVVYRHWFTTVVQMKSERLAAGKELELRMKPLPGEVALSGEWYLGIPSYSAAPDAGLELIKLMTSREAELSRYFLGIGLPTRADFYSPAKETRDRDLVGAPGFGVAHCGRLLAKAFHRSDLACYMQFSGILWSHLMRILLLSADGSRGDVASIRDACAGILSDAARDLRFAIDGTTHCDECSEKKRREHRHNG